jgi:hypothetical protein
VRLDDPAQVGPAWDAALAADRPMVIDAVVDPAELMIPPHFTLTVPPSDCTAWSRASSPPWPCRCRRWSSTAPNRYPTRGRRLVCGAVAAYFALGVLTGVVSHSSDLRRTISRIVTGIVVPLLLGLLATTVDGRTVVVCLALVVLAHLYFERRLPPVEGRT